MARAPQRSEAVPAFAGMIIFLVLSVVLAVVCVFLAAGYLKRGASLTKLQSEIKNDLEEPLRAKGLAVSALPVASASDVAYDDAFFTKIQKSASDGMNYAALVEKTGYTGENPIDDINVRAPEGAAAVDRRTSTTYIAKLIQDAGRRAAAVEREEPGPATGDRADEGRSGPSSPGERGPEGDRGQVRQGFAGRQGRLRQGPGRDQAADGESGRGGEESLGRESRRRPRSTRKRPPICRRRFRSWNRTYARSMRN